VKEGIALGLVDGLGAVSLFFVVIFVERERKRKEGRETRRK
jgi:hypothetical protein